MKKVVICLFVLSLILVPSFSQEKADSDFSQDTDAVVEISEVETEGDAADSEYIESAESDTADTNVPLSKTEDSTSNENPQESLNTNQIEANSSVANSHVNVELSPEQKIENKITEFRGYVEANHLSLNRTNDAEGIIEKIELKKAEIIELRKKIAEVAEVYYREVDSTTEELTLEILNAPIDIVESDGYGNLSDAAMQRRKNKCAEIEKAADDQKKAFLDELNETMGEDEKEAVSTLCSYYRALEMNKFLDTTYSSGAEIIIGEFNTNDGCWPVTYSIPMFGQDNVFRTTVKISYVDVTGEKFIPLTKMNDEEFMHFHNTLEFYTKVLKEVPEVLYGKLNFVVYRWKQASEYRMVPEKFEVSLLGGKRNKIVAKVTSNINPRVFVMTPAKEIRSDAEIASDAVKANKIIAQEAKAKESEADRLYKEYTSSYENSKKTTSKNPLIQKGRGVFLVSASKHFSDSIEFDSKSLMPDLVSMDLNFPCGKFAFWGFNGGLFVPIKDGEFNFEGGINVGLNVHVTNFLNPYLQASAVADSKYNGILKVGAGLDFIIGKMLLINMNYNFRWAYDLNNQLNPKIDRDSLTAEERNSIPCSSAHKISVGVGVAW